MSQNVALALPPQQLPSHDVISDASLLQRETHHLHASKGKKALQPRLLRGLAADLGEGTRCSSMAWLLYTLMENGACMPSLFV